MGLLRDLTLRLRANTAEYNKKMAEANKSTRGFSQRSKKTQQETQKAFQSIRGTFSNMVSSITGQIGGATGQLGQLAGAFQPAIAGIKGMTAGIKGMGAAFMATGIGAIIAGIGLALAAVARHLTSTREGMDLLNKITTVASNTFTVLLDRIGYLGAAIVKLFKRDFKGAAEEARKSYQGLGEQLKQTYDESLSIAENENKLKRDQIAFIKRKAELELQIAELLRKSREEELYDEEKRLGFVREAQKLQRQLSNESIELKERELKILDRSQALGENINKDDEERVRLSAEIINLKAQEEDKQRSLLRNATALSKAVKKQKEDQAEYNSLLELAEKSTKRLNPKPLQLDLEIKAPNLENLSQKIKPVQQNFDGLKSTLKELNVSFSTMHEFTSGLNMMPIADQIKVLHEKIDQAIPTFKHMGDALTNSFNQFAFTVKNAAVQGGESLRQLAKTARESAHAIIRSLIAEGVAHMVKNALKSSTLLGPIAPLIAPGMAAGAAAAATAAFNSLIPKFANGGMFNQGGLALVGERGPEFIQAPKDTKVIRSNHTMNMINRASNEINLSGEFRIKGTDLVLTLEETKRRLRNNH